MAGSILVWSLRHEIASVPQQCGTQSSLPPSVQSFFAGTSSDGMRRGQGELAFVQSASTPMSLNCGARSCVGWQRSKPAPLVACSLLICSSFCENGVGFTLMPVAFSKFGMTGLGNSSSQLMMLSDPEDD